MKKFALLIMAIIVCHIAAAQKYVPQISVGTVLNYSVTAGATGQQIALTLTVNTLKSPLSLKWDVTGYGTGTFEMTDTALANGSRMRISQPQPNVATRLKDDQTIMLISKHSFNDLVSTKSFTLNGAKFTLVTDKTAFQINDKDADVFHAQTADGTVNIWILNNPAFPLLCQLSGNPQGIDFTLLSVKE